MALAGKLLAAVAAIALPFLLLLDYYDGFTGWELYSGADIIITALCVIALGLLAASLASESPVFAFVVLMLGVFVFAVTLPIELPEVDAFGIGAWLVTIVAFVLILGAGLVILADILEEEDAGTPAPVTTDDPTKTAPTPSATEALADSTEGPLTSDRPPT
jgi:hypothetical protein